MDCLGMVRKQTSTMFQLLYCKDHWQSPGVREVNHLGRPSPWVPARTKNNAGRMVKQKNWKQWSIWMFPENSGFSPQIIHFNRVFYYKPSILGYPYFWKHPYYLHLGKRTEEFTQPSKGTPPTTTQKHEEQKKDVTHTNSQIHSHPFTYQPPLTTSFSNVLPTQPT